jgi:GTPase
MGEKLAYDYQPGSETIPVLLVGVNFGQSFFDVELAELGELAKTAGLMPVERVVCKRQVPDAALFVGSGKADEIRELVAANRIKEVLFDQSLSPAQQRNLERVLGVPVTDRTMLILEIFSQRARSHEGKLQVELARLQYLSTRLVRRWSHLERQRGLASLSAGRETNLSDIESSGLHKIGGVSAIKFFESHWSVTPMLASRRYSTHW